MTCVNVRIFLQRYQRKSNSSNVIFIKSTLIYFFNDYPLGTWQQCNLNFWWKKYNMIQCKYFFWCSNITTNHWFQMKRESYLSYIEKKSNKNLRWQYEKTFKWWKIFCVMHRWSNKDMTDLYIHFIYLKITSKHNVTSK